MRLRSYMNSRTSACVHPWAAQNPACSGPRTSAPWPPLPVGNHAGWRIEAANERRMASAELVSCCASWCGPSVGSSVTVVSASA